MIILAYPWVLLLLVLPWLLSRLLPPHQESRSGLNVPFLDRLAEVSGQVPGESSVVLRGSRLRRGMVLLAWTCVVMALARPQWIEPPITRTLPVRDLVLAVDLSGSMDTKDFTNVKGQKVQRLAAVKEVLDEFLSRRKDDRVGLIFFGSAAFVQAPFTQDLDVCRELLAEAQVSMAGPQTAFGDALGLAINVFDRSEAPERVLIALTDGNDTSSKVLPVKAAEIAKDKGIVIYTVAVGDPRAAGEDALDEETLKSVAGTTGGLYSFAANREQLEAVYQRLDALQTHKAQTVSYRPKSEEYYWPLGAGLVLTFLYHAFVLLRVAPGGRVDHRKITLFENNGGSKRRSLVSERKEDDPQLGSARKDEKGSGQSKEVLPEVHR
jgi:Ca-activated chloride channel family protein